MEGSGLHDFVDFILSQYVAVGEGELLPEKLPELLSLKYGSAADAVGKLGTVSGIRDNFRALQGELYSRD